MNLGREGILRNPRILGQGGVYVHMYMFIYMYSSSSNPGMNLGRVGDTRESQDTWTREGGLHTHDCTCTCT